MFKILGLMILGIIIGYGLRRISFLRKVEVSISYTVFFVAVCSGSYYWFQPTDCR